MDTAAVTVLLNASLEMDKATMVAAVRITANAVDRAKADYRPLPADMMRMLHLVSSANLRHLLERSKVTTIVTCMQPTGMGLTSAAMSYILDRPTTRPTTTLVLMDLSTITLQEVRP